MNFKCQAKTRFYGCRCDRLGTIERDGKYYCWQHDPKRKSEIALEKRKQLAEKEKQDDIDFEKKLKRKKIRKTGRN